MEDSLDKTASLFGQDGTDKFFVLKFVYRLNDCKREANNWNSCYPDNPCYAYEIDGNYYILLPYFRG